MITFPEKQDAFLLNSSEIFVVEINVTGIS
jgi:hypothetical protein